MGNYTVNDNWSVIGGATTGSATGSWDGGFDKQLDNWGGLASVIWTSDDKRSSAMVGGTYGQTATKEPWIMYNVVLQHRITPKTHFVVHHTHGWASNIFLQDGIKNAEWYSINTHLTYDLLKDLSIGIRAERFTDRDGWRVFSPYRILSATNNKGVSYAGNILFIGAPADYYQVTLGMNWKPAKRWKVDWKAMQRVNIRPNIRYDRADGIEMPFVRSMGEKISSCFPWTPPSPSKREGHCYKPPILRGSSTSAAAWVSFDRDALRLWEAAASRFVLRLFLQFRINA
jgi:hypothetical protein